MMDEKTMVSDTLTGINGELKMYPGNSFIK